MFFPPLPPKRKMLVCARVVFVYLSPPIMGVIGPGRGVDQKETQPKANDPGQNVASCAAWALANTSQTSKGVCGIYSGAGLIQVTGSLLIAWG